MENLSQRERNRQLVAYYFREYWTNGNPNVVDEVCSDDFVIQYPLHGRHVGKEAAKKLLTDFKAAFPSASFQLFSPFPLIAEDDYVVARWFGGGKHTGRAFFDLPVGSLPQAHSGKEMRFPGTTIFTLKDGKIVEEIGEESALVALQQLGIIETNKSSPSSST